MKAFILSVGTELTSGQVIDTNSAFLSRQLAGLGIATAMHATIGDDRAEIARAILAAAGQAEVVIVSGGLGPTEDDLTRQALADAMGTALEVNSHCLDAIRAFFRARNRQMNETNCIQAMVPRGAEPIDNHVGTAPGLYALLGKAQVFIVPGVPSEMEWMFRNAIAPKLPAQEGVMLYRILHTFGAGESDVGARIADLMRREANPLVGTTVAAGMVSIRVIAHARTPDEAQAMSDGTVAELRRRLGELVVGEGDATLPAAVGELLRKAGQTLTTAESCTGGLVGKLLTDVAGSSDYYLGGAVSYANRLKTGLLGVDESLLAEHGAVSEPVAMAMAKGARERLGSDWSIAVTGIAGPGGGTEAKPVGLVYVAVSGPDGTEVQKLTFPGTREMIRLRSALTGLNMVRLRLPRIDD